MGSDGSVLVAAAHIPQHAGRQEKAAAGQVVPKAEERTTQPSAQLPTYGKALATEAEHGRQELGYAGEDVTIFYTDKIVPVLEDHPKPLVHAKGRVMADALATANDKAGSTHLRGMMGSERNRMDDASPLGDHKDTIPEVKAGVEGCIRTLTDFAKTRDIATPGNLDLQDSSKGLVDKRLRSIERLQDRSNTRQDLRNLPQPYSAGSLGDHKDTSPEVRTGEKGYIGLGTTERQQDRSNTRQHRHSLSKSSYNPGSDQLPLSRHTKDTVSRYPEYLNERRKTEPQRCHDAKGDVRKQGGGGQELGDAREEVLISYNKVSFYHKDTTPEVEAGVEGCIRTLSDFAKTRDTAIPSKWLELGIALPEGGNMDSQRPLDAKLGSGDTSRALIKVSQELVIAGEDMSATSSLACDFGSSAWARRRTGKARCRAPRHSHLPLPAEPADTEDAGIGAGRRHHPGGRVPLSQAGEALPDQPRPGDQPDSGRAQERVRDQAGAARANSRARLARDPLAGPHSTANRPSGAGGRQG
jgi:hypothetical protein